MPINNRVFGSDIPIKVKKTLEARQLAASETRNPNEQINPSKYPDDREDYYNYGELLDNEFGGLADLSSRTPFIRMWTGVQTGIYEGADDVVMYEGETIETIANSSGDDVLAVLDDIERESEEAQAYKADNTTRFPKSQVSFQKESPNSTKGKYIVKRPARNINFSNPKVYMLGNHVLNTTDKITPQQQITADEFGQKTDSEQKDYITGEMFPDEHGVRNDVNKFLKPAAGIVSVSSETEGALGERKTTTINFVVHNFADFDAIYNRYFLRPGAQIFIDFGWSSVKDLYDPHEIIGTGEDGKDVESVMIEKLYGEKQSGDDIDGVVTKSKGNLEVVIGQVTNYDSKILENGSVECSLTIQSPNVAMMTFPKLSHLKQKIDFLLDHFFGFEAIKNFGTTIDTNPESPTYGQVISKPDFGEIPDSNSSAREVAQFEENVYKKASEAFGSTDFNPTVLASMAGLFLPGGEKSDAQYISLGFLEDKILNAEFAFGKNIDDVNDVKVKGLETKIDSSESFTFYNSVFHDKQSVIGNTGENDPVFLIPRFWDRTYNTITGHTPFYEEDFVFLETGTTIDTFNQEFDNWIATDITGNKDLDTTYFNEYPYEAPITDFDKAINGDDEDSLGRIPIREIFINSAVIKEAFGPESKSFKDIVKHILTKINEDSYGVFKLGLAGGQDNTLKIIDENYLGVDNTVEEDAFDKLFTFDIMSPNSIVKSYNVNLSLPNDAIGANVAIQALSGTNEQVLPVNEVISNAANLAEIFNLALENSDLSDIGAQQEDIKVKYLPDIGGFRGKALSDANSEKVTYESLYNTELKDGNDFYLNAGYSNIVNTDNAFEPIDDDEEEGNDNNATNEKGKDVRVIDSIDRGMVENHFFVTKTIQEYFQARISGTFSFKKNPPLPLKLELTIYGISSLVPGDIFKVDYLPKIYLKTCYFQITKVKHNIGSDGWYTTLETVFRYREIKSSANPIKGRYRDFAISAYLFDEFKIDDSQAYRHSGQRTMGFNGGRGYNDTAGIKKVPWIAGFRVGGLNSTFLVAKVVKSTVHDIRTFGDKVSVNSGPAPPGNVGNLYSYVGEERKIRPNHDIEIIQNFSQALGYMSHIKPVGVPPQCTEISMIFEFTVELGVKKAIVLTSPMYFSNAAYNAFDDFQDGYGGRGFPSETTGLYYKGDKVYLIFAKQNPQQFYGYVPAFKGIRRSIFGTTQEFDYTSPTTTDFIKDFGITAPSPDVASDLVLERLVKQKSDAGGYEQG